MTNSEHALTMTPELWRKLARRVVRNQKMRDDRRLLKLIYLRLKRGLRRFRLQAA